MIVHEEVFSEDGGAAGVAEEVEVGFLVVVGGGVVRAEAVAGEVGLGSGGPGGHGMGPQGGRPPMMGGSVDIEEIEKYNQKQEKKLQKILGDDLYNQWRSNHPLEAPKLPELELQ